jgi:hypothetical protein
MYKVHLEWQSRVCPIGVASLTRQFRRYFDRFEGRIREPPYAVYDDLAYTQGSPPTVIQSPTVDHDIGTAGGIMAGPNLEEYRERLRGFAFDVDNKEVMQNLYPSNEHQQNIGDLYNFGALVQNQHPIPSELHFSDQNQINEPVFSNVGSFHIPDAPGFTGDGTTQDVSPFELASMTSSQLSMRGTGPQMSDEISILFDEADIDLLENDLFGDMPDMPGLDGIIDQNFLEFLDSHQ